MKFVLTIMALWLFAMPQRPANSWHGLTPLRSTCDDVKKLLNIESCSMPLTNYELPEVHVMIQFAKGDCDKAPDGWRVSRDTVVALTISPQLPMRPAEFGLDLSKYRKRDDGEIVGLAHYSSEEEGVTVDVYAGVVQNLFLYPRKADDVRRCKTN